MATILLMDDDAKICRVIERTMATTGHTVYSAADGQEGLRLFERIQPDLAIIDIVMPQVEGVGAIRALRRAGHKLPILAISGNLGSDYLRVATHVGADRTLNKPFAPDDLVQLVTEMLELWVSSDSRS